MPPRTRRRIGRPPVGPKGQKRSEMRHQVTARISDSDYLLLRALGAALNTSQADVVTRGLAALYESLSPDARQIVRSLVRRGHETD